MIPSFPVFALIILFILEISSLTLKHAATQISQSNNEVFTIRTCQNTSKYLTGKLQDLNSPLKFQSKEKAVQNGREVLQFLNQHNLLILAKKKQKVSSHQHSQQNLQYEHSDEQNWSLWSTWLLPPQKTQPPKQKNKGQSWVLQSRPASAPAQTPLTQQQQKQQQAPKPQIAIKPSGIVFNKRSLLLDDLSNINSGGNSVLYDFVECFACTDDIDINIDQQSNDGYSISNIQLTQVNKLSTVVSFMWIDQDGQDGDVVFLNKDKNQDKLRDPLSCFIVQKHKLSEKAKHTNTII